MLKHSEENTTVTLILGIPVILILIALTVALCHFIKKQQTSKDSRRGASLQMAGQHSAVDGTDRV